MSTHLDRRNLVDAEAEAFKPPVFRPERTSLDHVRAALRRFLDLQAGSAWRDLRHELAGTSGILLDVGCGAQVFRSLVPPAVTYRGIDTKDAKERFGYAIPDTYYFEGNDWRVAERSVDVVLCTEVLEHIDAPLPFLQQIAHCLRPGGRFLLTVPFAARWHFIPYDYWRYTPSSLTALLSQAGFTDIRVTARGNPLTVACYKAMALLFMLAFGSSSSSLSRLLKGALFLVLSPIAALLALVGNLSLPADWGDDCLGYTVSAARAE